MQIIQTTFIPGYVAEQMIPEANQALIAIQDTFKNGYAYDPDWPALLEIQFDDIDTADPGYVVFDQAHARKIIDFITSIKQDDQIDTVLVHCNAGISRSSAVCKWISDISGCYFPTGYMLYNKHVYKILCQTYREGVFDVQQRNS